MIRLRRSAPLLALALAFAAGCAHSDDGILRGRVVGLSDGDTITVLEGKTRHKIRLQGIDAPERAQPFGTKSRENLSVLVFEKEVEVHWTKRDRWERILGKVLVDDPACSERRCPKIDVNLRQISGGFAWWYRRYAREQSAEDRRLYEEAERLSRSGRVGLWADPSPLPPWDWRRKPKTKKEGSPSRRQTKEKASEFAVP